MESFPSKPKNNQEQNFLDKILPSLFIFIRPEIRRIEKNIWSHKKLWKIFSNGSCQNIRDCIT